MIIGSRAIGPEHRPFIIAEVAQSHDGSLGAAFSFIDVAKECGADAIKFQTHIASEESTPGEPWRIPFSRQDATRYDYWERMQFTLEQWRMLKAHADAKGIIFLSSPFSIKACEWLRELQMPAWKIASGEVHNAQLLAWIEATGDPIIVSSGLSRADESRALVRRLRGQGASVALLHCTTRYPTPPEEVGLNVFETFASEFPEMPVGLSDHSGEIYPGVLAAYRGAAIIEVHLALHARMFGPDVSSSLTPDQLAQLVRGVDFAWRMRQHPIDKDAQLGALVKERSIFGRSLVAARDIAAGERIEEAMLAYKKPGGGMAFEERDKLVGRVVRTAIAKDKALGVGDVE